MWNNLGNVLRAQGAIGEAEAAYREAMRLAPRYADPLNGLGSLEAARDRPAVALALFDQALALDPSLLKVRLNRAIALELTGAGDEAVRAGLTAGHYESGSSLLDCAAG